MVKSLDKLKVGEKGVIVANKLLAGESARFCEMGFISGEKVEVLKKAPLGDPVEIRIMDYSVCIRLAQASCIAVKTVS